MREEQCIFCKIAHGDIPSKTIYEDDMFRVILDLAPATRGHALIIPKEHYRNLYDLPEEIASEAMKLAKKLITVMTEKLNCNGFHLLQNNEEAAGQTVFHFHLHLIPRYQDENNMLLWKAMEVSVEDLEEIRVQITG